MTEKEFQHGLSRSLFRESCLDRDDGTCVIPWCDRTVNPSGDDDGEVHHILERSLWPDGGYHRRNGASVCNPHHRAAEANHIPPQAFWKWIDVPPHTPVGVTGHSDKWGDEFEQPPWKEHRQLIKYPSTGHLPFSPEYEDNSVDHQSLSPFAGYPIVVMAKLDGGNAMIVCDEEQPVRARNGRHAEHQSFDMLKQLYWDENLYESIPDHIQIFGEWMYAKHSIHYGCTCDPACDDIGPELDRYFYIFGVYDTRYDLWLSWFEVTEWAEKLNFPTPPVVHSGTFEEWELRNGNENTSSLEMIAKETVAQGHEGIVVRSKYPYHYDQFAQRLGKYVRDGHVDPDAEHWKHRKNKRNVTHTNR